jgi:hypothetical protein
VFLVSYVLGILSNPSGNLKGNIALKLQFPFSGLHGGLSLKTETSDHCASSFYPYASAH